jgi:hypothetical protein
MFTIDLCLSRNLKLFYLSLKSFLFDYSMYTSHVDHLSLVIIQFSGFSIVHFELLHQYSKLRDDISNFTMLDARKKRLLTFVLKRRMK